MSFFCLQRSRFNDAGVNCALGTRPLFGWLNFLTGLFFDPHPDSSVGCATDTQTSILCVPGRKLKHVTERTQGLDLLDHFDLVSWNALDIPDVNDSQSLLVVYKKVLFVIQHSEEVNFLEIHLGCMKFSKD